MAAMEVVEVVAEVVILTVVVVDPLMVEMMAGSPEHRVKV
jgi:hypothetical protein